MCFSSSNQTSTTNSETKGMIENFITAFIVYFVVINPVGTAPIFLAITTHLNKRQKIRTALEGTFVAGAIMLFFALCGMWILHYLNIFFTTFRLAGGITLLLVALDTLTNKRQARREHGNDTLSIDDNIAFFPLATPLLVGPTAITSVMVVASSPAGKLDIVIGYGAMVSVMLATATVLIIASLAESYINPRVTRVFSQITAIILAALSIQYIIDGLQALGIIQISG
ncbi:MarC family protein [Alphaproteobacteria bacterium]|nr:MarC family protein [Alphaproteobacteria bacterium]